ncbi:hypothetical protein Pmani_005257 [Petrolisthes manimaculis]|uniref:Uncharacterized protein n=1 Tax=Petrolisthes manimaculis TaxID=1843537 RepID=A0AAE1QC31_9EUCA|nr:hypothetical protein Pmani_005257 [Petrolisthes manimaculis]
MSFDWRVLGLVGAHVSVKCGGNPTPCGVGYTGMVGVTQYNMRRYLDESPSLKFILRFVAFRQLHFVCMKIGCQQGLWELERDGGGGLEVSRWSTYHNSRHWKCHWGHTVDSGEQ